MTVRFCSGVQRVRSSSVEHMTFNHTEKVQLLPNPLYLDDNFISWKRNNKRFNYIKLDGKQATYCPDFWVEELDSYIEIKGYETELDRCKWSQFTEKLIVYKKKDLQDIGLI
jgi:hypothetical protein